MGSNPTLSAKSYNLKSKQAMRKKLSIVGILVLFLSISSISLGDTNSTSSPPLPPEGKERESQGEYKPLPVEILYSHTDALGKALALRLEEKIVSSNLFRPARKTEKRIVVEINSMPEFQEGSSVRSICSVVWTFFYQPETLTSYLDQSLHFLSRSSLDLIADDILAKTLSIAREYGYLFAPSNGGD